MGLLDLFRRTPPTANVAKERLRIIVAQERSSRGAPDFLPLLRRELRPQRGLPLFLVALLLEARVYVPQLPAPQSCLPFAAPTLSPPAHDSWEPGTLFRWR